MALDFLRVGVRTIRISVETAVEPSCCSVLGGTATAMPVIILIRSREHPVVAVIQAIPYNIIGYESF